MSETNDSLFNEPIDLLFAETRDPEDISISLPPLSAAEADQYFEIGFFPIRPRTRPPSPEKIIPEPLPPLPLRGEEEVNRGNDPRKQYQKQGWFLTWPQCPLSPQQALDILKKLPYPIKDFLIAQEQHKDGSYHLHAFLRYHKKVTWRANLWDLEQYHGNYQGANSWSAVIKYCSKGGNYISNFDIHAAETKKAARNHQLLTEEPRKLVDQGVIGVFQLPNLIKAKAAYNLLLPAVQTEDVRGIWITGATGVGKSHVVREVFGANLFLKSQSLWWDGYNGESAVCIDDYDIQPADHNKQDACVNVFGHRLKIWADKYACRGEIKGASINLHHRVFIVTSNYAIDTCFWFKGERELIPALKRRFLCLGYDRRDQHDTIVNHLKELYIRNGGHF